MREGAVLCLLVAMFLSLILICSCDESEEPPHAYVAVLEGSAYERGFQHGEMLSHRIKSLYATLLPNSLMPYLTREQPDIASVLVEYKTAENKPDSYYAHFMEECLASCTERCSEKCSFSYLLMRDSAYNLEKFLSDDIVSEMKGISDGSDMPYEEILILNTFLDTMLAFRAITLFIKQLQAPFILSYEVLADMDSDGFDNNNDGTLDEDDNKIKKYEPLPHAAMVEVPKDASVRFLVNDLKLGLGVDKGDEPGVDPCTIRIQLDQTQYAYDPECSADKNREKCVYADGSACNMEGFDCKDCLLTEFKDEGSTKMYATFKPKDGFKEASSVSILLQAGDFNEIVNPPPLHARYMRDERITFTTKGFGKKHHQVENRGEDDGRTQPPSYAFAVRGSATPDGKPLLANHYQLLDSNTTHEHTALFIHKPKDGIAHAVLGYSGVVWGFSGMNAEGLTYAFTNSDSLDNTMVKRFSEETFDAKLLCSGTPIGIMGRELLAKCSNVEEGIQYLSDTERTFGWNMLLADAEGNIAAVEMDSDIKDKDDGGLHAYTPDVDDENFENTDEHGLAWASEDKDDIRIASHYAKNVNDINDTIVVFTVNPQRFWTSFFFRSVRAWSILGSEISKRYGQIDSEGAIEIMRTPELVDDRDSMIAAVFSPSEGILRYAMGEVPATDQPFVEFDLKAELGIEDATGEEVAE